MKVFINQVGNRYAAEEATHSSDSQIANPSQELLALLQAADRPLGVEAINAAMAKYHALTGQTPKPPYLIS